MPVSLPKQETATYPARLHPLPKLLPSRQSHFFTLTLSLLQEDQNVFRLSFFCGASACPKRKKFYFISILAAQPFTLGILLYHLYNTYNTLPTTYLTLVKSHPLVVAGPRTERAKSGHRSYAAHISQPLQLTDQTARSIQIFGLLFNTYSLSHLALLLSPPLSLSLHQRGSVGFSFPPVPNTTKPFKCLPHRQQSSEKSPSLVLARSVCLHDISPVYSLPPFPRLTIVAFCMSSEMGG